MGQDYEITKNQRNSYLAKENLLKSRFEQVAPMEFYREIFPKGSLQKADAKEDGLGCAIYRFSPDKSTYKKMKARLRNELQYEIFKDSDALMQRFAEIWGALPVSSEEELKKRERELDKKFHAGEFLEKGKPIRMTYVDKKTGKEKEAKFDQRVHDDFSELGEAVGKRWAVMAPISYFGNKANGENARYLHAIVIDIDGVGINELRHIIAGIVDDAYYMCKPTFLVNSGRGIHLYYVLKNPVPLYNNMKEPLTRLKNGITHMVWNPKTSTISKPHDQPWYQGYRVVGSLSKLGTGYPATAWRTGEPVDIMDFNEYIFDEYRIQPLESYRPVGKSGHDKAYWKEANPEWYKRTFPEEFTEEELGKKEETAEETKKYPWLYRSLLPKVRLSAKIGYRYHSMCALFADAARGGIPYSEVYETAVSMLDMLNRYVIDEKDMFTISDIECAASYYSTSFGHWLTIDRLEAMTDLKFPRKERNYDKNRPEKQWWKKKGVLGNESRALWMNVIVADRRVGRIKDTRFGAEGGNKSGRKIGSKDSKQRERTADSKEQLVRDYLQEHPDAKKAEVIRETGLSKPTVYKWYDKIKEGDKSNETSN